MTYKIVQSDEKRTTFHKQIKLDTSRDTAILIRQSRKGSQVAHYESRLLQESLIPFVMQARGIVKIPIFAFTMKAQAYQERSVWINASNSEDCLKTS